MTNEGKLDMLHAMLRAALAARCNLVLHRIPAEAPGYALVVDKKEPNLNLEILRNHCLKVHRSFPTAASERLSTGTVHKVGRLPIQRLGH